MSKTIIAQSSKQKHPGKNQKYVGSRQGGPMEESRTKQQSIKHQNPEYFKRQADMKHKDSGKETYQEEHARLMKTDPKYKAEMEELKRSQNQTNAQKKEENRYELHKTYQNAPKKK